ncbi:MAG TPA: recombinase family protein [Pilimelia sp.]|nr:recombinase family protein [Pilimelia sp.]
MLVGYGRVSTREQNLARQQAALTAAGCAKCFFDKANGKNADPPGLRDAFEYLRPGDALTVVSLDRLGRSVEDLITIVGDTWQLYSRHLGLCLAARGSGETAAVATTCGSSPDQRWYPWRNPDFTFQFVNANSGLCLAARASASRRPLPPPVTGTPARTGRISTGTSTSPDR